jgi:hypothetical protein
MEYDLPVAFQSGTTALDEFGPGAGKGHAAADTGEDRIKFSHLITILCMLCKGNKIE